MLRHLGYACICLSVDVSCNHGTILRNATPERLEALIAQNLAALRDIFAFNEANGVRLFRLSSDIIPFGGHPVNALAWWRTHADTLAQLGAMLRRSGTRVSMHPGQYTLLSSPRADVTENAVRDLTWHARLLDALGVGPEGKLVTHGGGGYGDKPAALARWAERYAALPEAIRRRLVVENDERVFSVDDLLPLAQRTGVPIVVDTLHHRINPGTRSLGDALAAAFETWGAADGPPKTHFSSQDPAKKPGAHAEYADPAEFAAFLAVAPPQPFDCMLEAKAKDRALLRLRDQLAGVGAA